MHHIPVAIKNRWRHLSGFGLKRTLVIFSLLSMLILGGQTQAVALTSGYFTDDPDVTVGMTIGLSDASTADRTLVERARISKPDNIIGVAVRMEDALLTVTSTDSQIFVATDGEVQAYVNDLNGDIRKDDALAISPVRGILMKAGDNTVGVIGVALEDLSAVTTETMQVNGENNTTQTARLGQIKINIDPRIARGVPVEGQTYFERLGRSLTSQEVTEVQILAAFVIFLVLLVVEGGLMYGAIASTITALGRNPYSKRLIYIAFLRSLGLAVIVLLLGLGAMYLVLRL